MIILLNHCVFDIVMINYGGAFLYFVNVLHEQGEIMLILIHIVVGIFFWTGCCHGD